ncbi:hypothetical protein SLS62_005327 [Diatrype stigma]|uniref:NAD(P)-binding domain-containing protein n=1 Tax=Diatrype stigma TaxID=117547 RepID=A0AAN9UPY0_9PEZI
MASFVIIGANGHQGSATARALLAAGAKVHALVRDPQTEAAQQLASQGATLFTYRDFGDFDGVRAAAQGCRGVFMALWPTADAEAQARGIVAACAEAGVTSVVLSTAWYTGSPEKWNVGGGRGRGAQQLDPSPDPAMIEYFEGKAALERAVRESGLRHTVLRPSWIHYNYTLPLAAVAYPELVARAELAYPHDVDAVRMAHIDEADIGRFAAAAFLDSDSDPGRFDGEVIELGNENLTGREARDIIARVTGRDIGLRRKTAEEVEAAEAANPLQKFQRWASRVDVTIDGEALRRKYGIDLTSFEDYVRREKDRILATLPPVEQ